MSQPGQNPIERKHAAVLNIKLDENEAKLLGDFAAKHSWALSMAARTIIRRGLGIEEPVPARRSGRRG